MIVHRVLVNSPARKRGIRETSHLRDATLLRGVNLSLTRIPTIETSHYDSATYKHRLRKQGTWEITVEAARSTPIDMSVCLPPPNPGQQEDTLLY